MQTEGITVPIGFLKPAPQKDGWMEDTEALRKIDRIYEGVIRLEEQRAADVKEVVDLRDIVNKLETRLWFAVAGVAGAFGIAILGLIL